MALHANRIDFRRCKRLPWPVQAILWLLAISIALWLRRIILPAEWEHAICGAWGCGPRLMDLVSYHLVLMAIASGPMIFVRDRCRIADRDWIARFFMVGALAATTWLCAAELAKGGAYPVRRVLLRIATSVDTPIAVMLLGGVIFRKHREKMTGRVLQEAESQVCGEVKSSPSPSAAADKRQEDRKTGR